MPFKLRKNTAASKKIVRKEVKDGLRVYLSESLKSKQKTFYKSPRLRQYWGEEQLDFESWGELFFDLIYVAVAFRLGDGIAEVILEKEDYAEVLPYFVAQFFPMYTLWYFRAAYMSRFQMESLFHSVLDAIYALMTALMALFIGTRGEILESIQHKTEIVTNSTDDHRFFLATASDASGSMMEYNILLGFSVSYLLCQMIHLLRCIEMRLIVANHGIRKDSSEESKQTQRLSVITTASLDISRQVVSMALICVAVGAAYEKQIALTLTTLSLSFFSLIFFQVFIYLKLLNPQKKIKLVPLNVSFSIGRMGEFTMLMLGEGILQIIISIVDSDDLRGHLSTFIVSFGILAQFHFMAFYIVPTETENHAFRKSLNAAFLIAIIYPISTATLIFVGVALKLVLKKQADFQDEDNEAIRWLLAFSLFAAALSFILQHLIHVGWHEIFKKDFSEKGKKDTSWSNFNFRRVAFSMIYLLSPMLLLVVGLIKKTAVEVLLTSFFLLLLITSLGRVEKKYFSEVFDEEDYDRRIQGLLTEEECEILKGMMKKRIAGELKDGDKETMKEGISNVKDRVEILLKFLRNKSHKLGNDVKNTEAMDSDTTEEENLLDGVQEIVTVADLIREQLESLVPRSESTVAIVDEEDVDTKEDEGEELVIEQPAETSSGSSVKQ